jgi:hypothetical protein
VTEEITTPTVEAIVAVVETDATSILSQIYFVGLYYAMILMLLCATYIVIRHLVYESLKFNYHYYLAHGEFVIVWPGENEQTKAARITAIAKANNINDITFISWGATIIMSVVIIAVCSFIAVAWPITTFTTLPLLILRLVAYKKRRKITFTQKLKGNHLEKDDGSV